jgi:predicted PurR-regulated permease PerM
MCTIRLPRWRPSQPSYLTILVGSDTKMPDYVVLISTLGGIEIFGMNGIVLGPLIAAMFLVVWDILSASRRPQV